MLRGRIALITGSTGGIGYAAAQALASQGCHVMLNGFGEPDEIRERCTQLGATGDIKVAHHGADLRHQGEIEDLVATAERTLGGVDILVNNAVVRHFAPIEEFKVEDWHESLDVNLTAGFHLIRLTLSGMRRRGFGRIVNLASTLGIIAMPDRIDYIVTKTALLGLTRGIAIETQQEKNITVNAICPGAVRTPASQSRIGDLAAARGISLEEAEREFLSGRQPTRRFIEPEQVGALIAFLCTDAAQEITGAAIPIDAGWTISP
jgi:3-hydroxybutyrate dehydrogenase